MCVFVSIYVSKSVPIPLLNHRTNILSLFGLVDSGCRIHQLHICTGVRLLQDECPGYDTKQSDVDAPVMLEFWRMWSTPSYPSLPGPIWPGSLAPDRVLSRDQIELKCYYAKLTCLKLTTFTFFTLTVWLNCVLELFKIELFCHLTVCKKLYLY